MPPDHVLPLFDAPAHPDAWHRVAAPGGYEWWRFDAEDDATGVRVVATFYDGYPFHPEYLRRYRRYLRRPTRHRPPQAREYPCVEITVVGSGKPVVRVVSQHPPGAFSASAEQPEGRLGSDTFRLLDDGAVQLILQDLSAELTFRPVPDSPPCEVPFLPRATAGAEHRWVVAQPLCKVEGRGRLAADGQMVAFSGRGYHDHHYGTGSIGPGIRRWMRGRVLSGAAP